MLIILIFLIKRKIFSSGSTQLIYPSTGPMISMKTNDKKIKDETKKLKRNHVAAL